MVCVEDWRRPSHAHADCVLAVTGGPPGVNVEKCSFVAAARRAVRGDATRGGEVMRHANSWGAITAWVVTLMLLLSGSAAWVQAQPTSVPDFSWFEDPEEPVLSRVEGTLTDIRTLRIRIVIRGVERVLAASDALVYLSVRHYIEFDPQRGRYVPTDKYRHWLAGQPTVPPVPPTAWQMPAQFTLCEPICATLRWDGLTRTYELRGQNGAVGRVAVQAFSPSAGVSMSRTDPQGIVGGSASPGLTAVYAGRITGPRQAQGTVEWQWHWNGPWQTRRGTWVANW